LTEKPSCTYVAMGPFFRTRLVDGTVGTINGAVTLNEKGFRLVTKKGWRGTSAEFRIKRYLCAVCRRDYEECPHTNVGLIPEGVTPESVSLVRNPRAGTYLTDVLAVKTTKKHRHYRWIGYAAGAGSRMERIRERLESGELSRTAAAVISGHFASRKSGECRYTERVP